MLALVLTVTLAPVAGAEEVTQEDIAAAEAAERDASQRLAEVREDLADAVAMRERMTATIESLTNRSSNAEETAVAEAVAVRSRLTRMYMAAGRPDVLLSAVEDVGRYFTRLAYLGAIAERDRTEVNRFVVLIEDLDSLRVQAEVELDELAGEVAALELLSASRAAALEEATEKLRETRETWAEQEAARQAALEAELRRQEAELARQAAAAATTTTTAPPAAATTTTTTTSAPPAGGGDGGYTYDPNGGVEQWRPLLTSAFARWGLTQEKCGPAGCVGSAVEGALTIMWCESRGVPFVVNPSSGTTGLFQHRPVFWSDRVARTRSYSWASLPPDATPYNAAHNIEVAALLIYESRETLIGNLSYGRPWSDGPQPFGHWDSTSRYCADPPLVWP